VQLEELQAKYEQLLLKYECTSDQLQRAARVERQRAKCAKGEALRQSAQQGELHNIVQSLLERVRSQRVEAGGVDGSRRFHGGGPCSRPHTAIGPLPAGVNHAPTRPISAVNRPFSGRAKKCHTSREAGFRHGRQMRPLSSPNWGAKNSGEHKSHVRMRGLNLVLEEFIDGHRPDGAPQRQSIRRFGVDLSETEQDELIRELMRQEQVLELLQAAVVQKHGSTIPGVGMNLTEDDEGVEVLNEDGVWVVR
jgi:hypothetical protein